MSSDSSKLLPNVLIVEDDMMLRMRTVDLVEDAGFNSIEAVSADEALSILETRSDISLLFTDIQMPGSLDGLMLAQEVYRRWPSIKIILVSGAVTPSGTDMPADSSFFRKPLEVTLLIAELQKMIGAGPLAVIQKIATPTEVELLPNSKAEGPELNSTTQGVLTAENDSLRLLLEQASIDAKVLLAQAGIDAEERQAADKLQKLIVGELHHRIKNTLATVSAIASQSLRAATSIEHGLLAIESRLIALGRAHDLLMEANWANASLAPTVRGVIEPYDRKDAARISIDGPDIRITSGAVISLALTLNELCTNTTKFGALSVPAGRVEIAWTLDDEKQRLRLTWTEKDGPAVREPTRRGFGTRMIASLGQQLSGHVHLVYEPTGFIFALDVPLSSLMAKL